MTISLAFVNGFSMNEVSKCAEINCSSFENFHFLIQDVNIEIWILKVTVRKLLLSSLHHVLLNTYVFRPLLDKMSPGCRVSNTYQKFSYQILIRFYRLFK